MTARGTCGKLVVETHRIYIRPIDKGKPFERVGHKALEPTSLKRLKVVSCQEDKTV